MLVVMATALPSSSTMLRWLVEGSSAVLSIRSLRRDGSPGATVSAALSGEMSRERVAR